MTIPQFLFVFTLPIGFLWLMYLIGKEIQKVKKTETPTISTRWDCPHGISYRYICEECMDEMLKEEEK